MTKGIQSLCITLGEGGCYQFSIMKAAEYEMNLAIDDPVAFHAECVAARLVASDCTVLLPGQVMAKHCGGEWTVLKAGNGADSAGRLYDLPLDYVIGAGEHDIARYEWTVEERPGIQHVYGHFFYVGPSPLFDPMDNGIAQARGHLVSRRILRKIA